MNKIHPVKFVWGNTKNWALNNHRNGICALVSGAGSTVLNCLQDCTEDITTNKILGFGKSFLSGFRNKFEYSIYSGANDDLEEDKTLRPEAAKVGQIACFIEKKINPWLLPALAILGGNMEESYNSIANWFNAMWWRARLCYEHMNWKKTTKLPSYFNVLFQKDLSTKKEAANNIVEIIKPFLGWVGAAFTGLFIPAKSALNSFGIKTI